MLTLDRWTSHFLYEEQRSAAVMLSPITYSLEKKQSIEKKQASDVNLIFSFNQRQVMMMWRKEDNQSWQISSHVILIIPIELIFIDNSLQFWTIFEK